MIRRVLMATINADHPQRGMTQAFRSTFPEVADFDYLRLARSGLSHGEVGRRFVEAAASFRPDWAWLQLQDMGTIAPSAIEEAKERCPRAVFTHWTGDVRREVGPYTAAVSRACHATFVSSVGQLPMYARAAGEGRFVRYLQIAVDWEEDVLGLPAWEPPFRVPDVVFAGGHYGPMFPGTRDREEAVLALLGAGVDVGVVGGGWPAGFPVAGSCHVKAQHHVYRRAKAVLSVSNFNDIELYYSDRQLIAMASGRPVLAKRVPGLEREFEDGRHLVMFDGPEDLVPKALSLLADPARQEAVGLAGREEVVRNHTWWSRLNEALPLVEEIAAGLG